MSTLIPPSRLLPVTIAATALALTVKTFTVISMAPSPAALWAGTTQALEIASTAGVIGQAKAAQPMPPPPSASPTLPRTAPSEEASPNRGAEARRAVAPPRVEVPSDEPVAEVKQRASPIEEREQRLAEREAMLAATDKQLTSRVGELLAIQARLESLENQRKAHEEANWTGLVKVYESMRPREAASIFNSLDKPVLLEILDRMKPAKASPIIALMEPESARLITAELADKRTHDTTVLN